MLPHYLGAPTLITIGGIPHLADRLRLGDFALLLQAAADALGRDCDAGDLPEFGDPTTSVWLATDGLPLTLWCSLRRNWPELRVPDVFDLVGRTEAGELESIFNAAFRHGRREAGETPSDSVDIALGKWGRAIRWFADHNKGLPPQVGEYTLDQANLLMAEHDPERAKEAAEAAKLTEQINERWGMVEEARERAKSDPRQMTVREHLAEMGWDVGPGLPGQIVKPPETIADLGYAIMPGQELPEETKADEHGMGPIAAGEDGKTDDVGPDYGRPAIRPTGGPPDISTPTDPAVLRQTHDGDEAAGPEVGEEIGYVKSEAETMAALAEKAERTTGEAVRLVKEQRETKPDASEHEVKAESGLEATDAKSAKPRRPRRNRKA